MAKKEHMRAINVERRKKKKIRARPDNVCLLLFFFGYFRHLNSTASVEKVVTQQINV